MSLYREFLYFVDLFVALTRCVVMTTFHHFFHSDTPIPKDNPLSYKLATSLFRTMLDVDARLHTLQRVRRLFDFSDFFIDGFLSPTIVNHLTSSNFTLKTGHFTFNLSKIQQLERQFQSNNPGDYIVPTEVEDEINGLSSKGRTPRDSYTIKYEHISSPSNTSKLIIYVHGGGYCFLTPTTCRHLSYLLSHYTKCNVLAIDYRRAGEHPFPAAIHDLLSVYLQVISHVSNPTTSTTFTQQFNPEDLILYGDSAGAGIVCSFLVYLGHHSLPLPSNVILSSPFVDLTCTHSSWKKHGRICALPEIIGPDGNLMKRIYLANGYGGSPNPIWGYVNGWSLDPYSRQFWNDEEQETLFESDSSHENDSRRKRVEKMVLHPFISPSRTADFTFLNNSNTRILIQSGEKEVLLDESHDLVSKLSMFLPSKVENQPKIVHQVLQDMHHDFILFGDGNYIGPKQIRFALERVSDFISCNQSSQGIERCFVNKKNDSILF